jgi:hypothetical protein
MTDRSGDDARQREHDNDGSDNRPLGADTNAAASMPMAASNAAATMKNSCSPGLCSQRLESTLAPSTTLTLSTQRNASRRSRLGKCEPQSGRY